MGVTARPVTAARWDDFAAFAGPSGLYSGCWCTYFRRKGAEFDAGCRNKGVGNREFLSRLTEEGRVPGLLAYGDDRDRSVGLGRSALGLRSRPASRSSSRLPRSRPSRTSGRWSASTSPDPLGARVSRPHSSSRKTYATGRRAGIEGYPVTRGRRRPHRALHRHLDLSPRAGFTEAFRRFPSAGSPFRGPSAESRASSVAVLNVS